MGEWDTASPRAEELPHMEFNVSRVFIHPAFNISNLHNSIAILRLRQNVPLGFFPTIGTACLPSKFGQCFFNNVPQIFIKFEEYFKVYYVCSETVMFFYSETSLLVPTWPPPRKLITLKICCYLTETPILNLRCFVAGTNSHCYEMIAIKR